MKNWMKVLGVLALSMSLGAQSYTNCAGFAETQQQWINAGTPLLIASKGFDCSICVNQANMVGIWAANNPQIRVWGAMTYTYNPGAIPSCTELNNWVNTHNWQGVFAFVDSNRTFYAQGTPRYYVYAPLSGVKVYDGFSFNQATQIAQSYVNTVSIGENLSTEWQLMIQPTGFLIQNAPINQSFEVVDLTGRVLLKGLIESGTAQTVSMTEFPNSTYLLKMGNRVKKLIWSMH